MRVDVVDVDVEDLQSWPSLGLAARQAKISSVWMHELLKSGRVKYFQTTAGRLVDPVSLQLFIRARRRNRRGRTVAVE